MLTDEDFIRLYPTTRTIEIATEMGLTPRQVRYIAQRQGLRKSQEILSLERSLQNKGRIRSDETREKLRQAQIGKKVPTVVRAKISLRLRARSAEKRGIPLEEWTPLPRRVIRSTEYVAWRTAVYERDSYTCQDCGYIGEPKTRAVYAHHILDWHHHPDSRYDVSNGVTLCFSCHAKRHGWNTRTKEPVLCACGCGQLIPPSDRWRKPRRFILGHWIRTRPMTDELRQNISLGRKGIYVSPEGRRRHAQIMREKFGGKKRAPEICAKISATKMGHPVSTKTRDKLRKITSEQHRNRTARGIKHHNAKILDSSIKDIREAHINGKKIETLAEQYSVSKSCIERIVYRMTYKHII